MTNNPLEELQKYLDDNNITLEEYLSKSPLTYNIGSPYTPLTPPNTTKIVHNSHPNDPKPYFDTYGGVKAEPYKDVRAYWDKKGVMRPNWDNRVEGVDY